MNELQAQLAELEGQKGSLFENDTVDQAEVSQLNDKIAEVQKQIDQFAAQQADAEQLAQDKEAKLDKLAQQISDLNIFGALFPEDGFKEKLGINAYEEKRQMTNQLLHALVTEFQSGAIDEYNDKIATTLGQNRQLTVRAEDAESQLEQEKTKAAQEIEQIKEQLNVQLAQKDTQLAQKDTEVANLKEQLLMKQERIDELKEELEQAPAPTALKIDVTPKPSQSLADLISATREQSNRSIKTAQQLALEGTSYRGKVLLGSTGAPIAELNGGSESTDSFRSEVAEAITGNGEVSNTEAPITPPPFQGDMATGDGSVSEMVEDAPVTRCEFEALKRDVELLKQGQVYGDAA